MLEVWTIGKQRTYSSATNRDRDRIARQLDSRDAAACIRPQGRKGCVVVYRTPTVGGARLYDLVRELAGGGLRPLAHAEPARRAVDIALEALGMGGGE